tara:strand:+ start:253 stop:771 length:519 start_codon:yes stop_codon:yes gene_type:complete
MNNVTIHNVISKYYFSLIYYLCIKIADLKTSKIILDFGCGNGYLKKMIIKNYNVKVINYDIIEKFCDIKNWTKINFDTIFFIQVFYFLESKQILNILSKIGPRCKIIVAFSTQSFLNKIFKFILGHADAHEGTKTSPDKEYKILQSNCRILKCHNYFLFKILFLKKLNKKIF